MKHAPPKNLNLFTMYFPMPAIVSILHRISGVILFLVIPFFLWMLKNSLASQQGFDYLAECLSYFWVKLFLWLCLAAFIYHFFAGVRHLLMDAGVGEDLRSSKIIISVMFILIAIFIILIGVWLW